MGQIGLAYDDFCRLTPDEFRHVCKAYQDRQEADYKDEWARMRMLATIVVQPHVKKKLAPKDLLPFPWEKAPKRKAVSLQEDKESLERLLKKIKKD